MIAKIFLIALISLILTGCDNNKVSNNDTNYERLSYSNDSMNNNENLNDNNSNHMDDNTEDNSNDTNYINEIKEDIYGSPNDIYSSTPNSNNLNSISTYTTKILTTDPDRYNNIKIVRDRLNGYVLRDGETFSYNEVCGPYGKDDGFEKATILLSDGSHEEGYGGGVCQLSSTLYNAVKNIGVNIIERHHHSVPVAYVPKDEDATVSLQSNLDFKFVNTTGRDLRFEATSTPNSLTVSVYED